MDSYQTLQALLAKVQSHRSDVEEEVVKGTCKTFDEYRYMCGQIESILYTEQQILDTMDLIDIS